jgi:hypothetical protein
VDSHKRAENSMSAATGFMLKKNEAEAAVDHIFAEKTQTTVLFYLPVSTHIVSAGKREFSDRLLPA